MSALKTTIVMFTWNWAIRVISVGGNTISLSNTVKFLGVTLDSKLKYDTHNVTQIATTALMQCERAVGPKSPKTFKWIYRTDNKHNVK